MPNIALPRGSRALLLMFSLAFTLTSVWGQRMDRVRAARMLRRPHAEAQFIIKFRGAAAMPTADEVAPYSAGGVRELQRIGEGEFHLLQTNESGQDVLSALSEYPEIEYIEPNYVINVDKTPNDPLLNQQWGLKNTTTVNADIAATAAWDYTTGTRQTVVAVIDTGVDFNHPDLAANIWKAPRPFTFNGAAGVVTCPAGSRGVNAITSSCEPLDDNGHGTHCAGIIGAGGNNASGVAGVNWTASILPVKAIDSRGSGLLSNALRAIDAVVQIKRQFAADANVRVINASWGFSGNSQALDGAIAAANSADLLFVAAAGNAGANNDTTASAPANSTQPNVISVAATDNRDALATFSNYGTKVHLGAPGVSITSTYLNGQYVMLSGTSMAAPFVAGAAALVLSTCTADTATLRQHLLASVDPVLALTGKTETGGRLNVYKAIRRCATPAATLSATPTAQTVKAGTATSYSLLPGGAGGVSGGGTIIVTGAPAGVTAAIAGPVTLGSAVTLSVNTTTNVVAGTYKLTATLTASTYTASVPLTLTVQPAQMFTFTATPPAAPVKTGTSAAIGVSIVRTNGFTGAVVVTPQGLPANFTAPAVTIASGQTTASVTVTVATTAAAGAVNFSLIATGGTPVTTLTAPAAISVEAPSALSMSFGAPKYTVKAGSPANLVFTVNSTTPLTSMQFALSGLPGPASLQLASTGPGAFRLVIATPTTWAKGTATVMLTLTANGLKTSATSTLIVIR